MSPNECRKHNLTQLVALLQTKEQINALDEDALSSYKNMIDEYFNKHKNIFQYTDAALELKLLSENIEYRTMVENFINNKGSKYDLEKSQNKKSDLINKMFNEDYEISNMDQIKKIMSPNILHPQSQIQEAYNEKNKAEETMQNFWLRLLDSILNALRFIDFFHILPQSNETKQKEIIAKNEKIINTLNDINNKITENLITNFDNLLQDEQNLANKTTEISNKIEQIKELEENMKSDQLNSYLAYLTDGVNNIIDNLYSNNSDADELKNAFENEINTKKGNNEKIKACKKFLHENLNLSVNGGIKTTLLNTPKNEIAAKLNNIVEQMYGNTDQATEQKTKDFLEKNFNNDNENATIVFLSEVNKSSQKEIENYSHYNVTGDIAMINNQGIKEAECNKNPLGDIRFKTDVQIVKHDDMTIYHMHNTSNAGEKKQLNSFTQALGRSDQLGIMVGDFNYGFNGADHVMVIKAEDAQGKLNNLDQLVRDMENADKTMIYLQPYQNIDMTRGAQPGNQQSAIKVNIEKKPDNNGILLNIKFLQEMQKQGNTINFKSTDKKEVLGFDHNTANLDINKNGKKLLSLIVQNLFNDRSEKNNKVYSNIANVTNQDALNNFNGNVSGLFYENTLKYLSSSQQKQSIKEIMGDKNARDKFNFKFNKLDDF